MPQCAFLIYVKLLLLFVLNMGEEIAMWRIRGTFAVMGRRLIVGDEFLSLRSLNRNYAFSEVVHDRFLIFCTSL